MKRFGRVLYLIFCIVVAMIGYEIHSSVILAIINFIFAPLALIWFLISHQICLSVIKEVFSFILK